MKTAISKLEMACVVSRVWPTSSLRLPLQRRAKSAPKLLPLDVGIAASTSGLSIDQARRLPLEDLLDGRLAEIFVGQELLTSRSIADDLFFWVRDTSRGNAEVDYLLESDGGVVPSRSRPEHQAPSNRCTSFCGVPAGMSDSDSSRARTPMSTFECVWLMAS